MNSEPPQPAGSHQRGMMTVGASGLRAALPWATLAAQQWIAENRDAETVADLDAAGLSGYKLLHLNESPYPPSPRAVEAVVAGLRTITRYPSPRARPLISALAAHTGIAADHIVVGAGTTELIFYISAIALSVGDHVVLPVPTYPGFFHAARLCGAKVIRTPLDRHGASDADALAAAVTDRTRVVFCCTPNAPSGGMMDHAAVEKIAASIPDSVLLVIDEAYYEFARMAGGPDVLAIMAKRRGAWAVLRTFSKAYGLAGLRIGYALCGSDEVVGVLRRAMLPYNVAGASQAAAIAALGDRDDLARVVAAVAHERQRMSEGLAVLGLNPFPSAANFVSVRLPFPATRGIEELRRRSILVRGWRDPGHCQEIRITVGLPDDTDSLLAGMKEILALDPGA
jgi:histidinol-phosphate aminotransferase